MSSKRISKPFSSFNKNNGFLNQINIKQIFIDFIYNNVNMNMIERERLNDVNLKKLTLDYVAQPIINGIECLCVIMKNKNHYYSCLVEKDELKKNKNDICINNINILWFDVSFSDLSIYNGTILDGIYKYESETNKTGNEEFFIVNDIYYLNGENVMNEKITNKFSKLRSYLNHFSMDKFNFFLNNFKSVDNDDVKDMIMKLVDNRNNSCVLENKNMKLNVSNSVNGFAFYSNKTNVILEMKFNNNRQKVSANDINKFDETTFTYSPTLVIAPGEHYLNFYYHTNRLFLAEPISKSFSEAKTKSKPFFICSPRDSKIGSIKNGTIVSCKVETGKITVENYVNVKVPNKLSDLIELVMQ